MGRRRIAITEGALERARELRAEGVGWGTIGARLGYHEDTLRRRLDPEHAERMKFKYSGPKSLLYVAGESRISSAEARRLIAAVPCDTRSRHARFMGDPLPGRSALDRRHRSP